MKHERVDAYYLTKNWKKEILRLMGDFCISVKKQDEIVQKVEQASEGKHWTARQKYDYAWRLFRDEVMLY